MTPRNWLRLSVNYEKYRSFIVAFYNILANVVCFCGSFRPEMFRNDIAHKIVTRVINCVLYFNNLRNYVRH